MLMSLHIFNAVEVEEDPDLRIVVDDWETRREPSTGQVARQQMTMLCIVNLSL